jgi:DNA-binding CsgD family transcriptional regulator
MNKQKKHNYNWLIVLFFILFCYTAFPNIVYTSQKERADTAKINTLTEEAYLTARKNPEQSVSAAHSALKVSKKANYKKGIADANLALGAAYMAKHNPNDSATFYCHRALNLHTQLNDLKGMARACYGLSFIYNFKSQAQKAIEYGKLSVEYFEKAGRQREVIAALDAVIFLEKQQNNYEKALQLSDKAIKISQTLNDTLQWANALNNKGNILKDMFLFNPAIDAYFDAFQLWELANDTSGLAIAYGSIANAYFFEGDYKKSLEYNFKKLPITINGGNLWETNKTMSNIALSYSNLNKPDSALFYMKQSLKIAKKMNYPEGVANSYNNMASTYLSLEITDSTLVYSSKAIAIAEKINSPNLAKYKISKAMAFNHQKKYNEALVLAKKSYNLAKQRNDKHIVKDASFLLSEIHHHLGQRSLAYPFLTEYIKLHDSISNMEYMRKVTRLDIQHEYETKQKTAEFEIEKSKQQIEILNKTNFIKSQRIKIFWIVIMSIILLSFAGAFISFLVIRNQNHRIEQMKLEIRNYLLNSEPTKKEASNKNPIEILIAKYNLTQREAEIMELISTGIGNEEIANKLFVSRNTVKFHIKNIFIKLDVKNRVQALQKSAM